jgi:hypothetical protein
MTSCACLMSRGRPDFSSVDYLTGSLGIIPINRSVRAIGEDPGWNYTTVLNIVFLAVAAVLVVRFLRTGGLAMLRMMSAPEAAMPMDHTPHGGNARSGRDHHAMGHDHATEGESSDAS